MRSMHDDKGEISLVDTRPSMEHCVRINKRQEMDEAPMHEYRGTFVAKEVGHEPLDGGNEA